MNKRAKRVSLVITSMFVLASANDLQAMNNGSNEQNIQSNFYTSSRNPNISFNNNTQNQEVINTDINNKDNNEEKPEDSNERNDINNNNNEEQGEEQYEEQGEEQYEEQGEEQYEEQGEEQYEEQGEEQYEEQGDIEGEEQYEEQGEEENPKYPNENNINENNMVDSNVNNGGIDNNISDSNKINENEEEEKNNISQIKIKNNINQIRNSMNLNASENLFGIQDNILGDTPQPLDEQEPEEQEIDPNFSYNDFVNSSPRGVEDGYVQRCKISANDFYTLLGHFRDSESVKIVNDIKNLNKDLFKTKYRSIELAGDIIGVLASVYDTNRTDITNYVFINYSKVDNNIGQFDRIIEKSMEEEIERLSEKVSDKFSRKTTINVRKYALDKNGIHSMN